ncbi:colony stimulating factor 3 (granulocyte) a isoform X2 [Megalobrama amblycephala]|uniref:colony stimulating factor 3 (granulocyte) a isoform X2 n=1 Tax=Megalobrama amblycephala TaxID=75352 RepID=UPI0020147375|nr:colony stimulating factor 3 (granulocyte) a isoform X2 [Megalobrama amblycephala]
MMGLCYCWSLVTLHIFFFIAVLIMNFQALLVTLVGIVGSAPVSHKLDIMDKDTIAQAHSLISKILKDIPTVHTAWIKSPSFTLGDSRELLLNLKEKMIPSAPVLQNISSSFSLETCLAHIVKGLQLHLNLLEEISNSSMLDQTDQVINLKAEIEDLLFQIKELQNQAEFDHSQQESGKQSQTGVAKHLTNEYVTSVAAHLTLQQLQDFSYDVLRSILSMRSMASISENTTTTMQLWVNAAGV